MPRDYGGQGTTGEVSAGYSGGVTSGDYSALQDYYDGSGSLGGGLGLDQFGLSSDDERWLMDNLGVGGTVGLDLLQSGAYNEKLRLQAQEAVAGIDAQVRYAQINAQAAQAAGDLREAKRWHDMQQQLEQQKLAFEQQQLATQAQSQYSSDLMKMASNPQQMFQYDWARYGLQPPRGGAPPPLPIPDAVKPLLQNPTAPTAQGNQQTPVSQNPSLASLIPGAQPSTAGTPMPAPTAAPMGGLLPGMAGVPGTSAPSMPGGASPAGIQSAAAANIGRPQVGAPMPNAIAGALNPTSREFGAFATQPILPAVNVPTKSIGPNTTGPDVVALQRALERLGYFQLPAGANYGVYGPVTTAAVARFQSDFGINAGTPGLWDATSAKALRARVEAIGNQPVGPSPFNVRGSDVAQSPQGLPEQRMMTSLAAGIAPQPGLPGQTGAPSTDQSNAAAQPGAQNFPGATVTLTPALQALFAQEGNAQSQVPIQPPSGYQFPDLGAISAQSYNRLTPTEQGQYQGYENDVAGKPSQDVVGDINRLAPQGAGLEEPTTFMAQGGMINEPTVARGLITGHRSMMGETGPERITPATSGQTPSTPTPMPPHLARLMSGPRQQAAGAQSPMTAAAPAAPSAAGGGTATPSASAPPARPQLKSLRLDFHPALAAGA